MKMSAILALLLVGIVRCAEAPVEYQGEKTGAAGAPGPAIQAEKTLDQSLALTGDTFTILPQPPGERNISPAQAKNLTAAIRALFEKKGLKYTDKIADSYGSVWIAASSYLPSPDQKVIVTESYEKYVNGELVEAESSDGKAEKHWLTMAFQIHEYGIRPKPYFTVKLSTNRPFSADFKDVTGVLAENLKAIPLAPPAKNLKMAGKPGCMPRLGFESTVFWDGQKWTYKIVEVLASGPAAKAGLRVGDILEAIDSKPYDDFRAYESDIYEKRARVPLRLLRNGQVVRTQIQAEIMCK
jgi:hypothetical protein